MKSVVRAVVTGLAVLVPAAILVSATPAGKLKVATPGLVLQLKVRGRKVAVPPNREVALPPGSYKVASVQLYTPESARSKRLWRLEGVTAGTFAAVRITDGETTTIEGGQPITVKTPVRITKTAAGRVVLIGLSFTGTTGEAYRTVVYKGNVRTPNPKLTIVAENGKVLGKGQFEYG
jgi:hypothetical protein